MKEKTEKSSGMVRYAKRNPHITVKDQQQLSPGMGIIMQRDFVALTSSTALVPEGLCPAQMVNSLLKHTWFKLLVNCHV